MYLTNEWQETLTVLKSCYAWQCHVSHILVISGLITRHLFAIWSDSKVTWEPFDTPYSLKLVSVGPWSSFKSARATSCGRPLWKYFFLNIFGLIYYIFRKKWGGAELPLHGPCALAPRNKAVPPFLLSELPPVTPPIWNIIIYWAGNDTISYVNVLC